jgi:hypothetical protein
MKFSNQSNVNINSSDLAQPGMTRLEDCMQIEEFPGPATLRPLYFMCTDRLNNSMIGSMNFRNDDMQSTYLQNEVQHFL